MSVRIAQRRPPSFMCAAESAVGYDSGTSPRPTTVHDAERAVGADPIQTTSEPLEHGESLDRLVDVAESFLRASQQMREVTADDHYREIRILDQLVRRLQARQTRLIGMLSNGPGLPGAQGVMDGADPLGGADASDHSRPPGGADTDAQPAAPTRADLRSRRALQDQLRDELRWSPSQAKKAVDAAQHLAARPQAARAYDAGMLTDRHLAVLDQTLRYIAVDRRDDLAMELVEVAQVQDPVSFGRTCRRRLAELDHDGATRAERFRHSCRSVRMAPSDDGMLRLNAQLSGLDAETVATAIHAFRTPDSVGMQPRRPEQATADALVEVCRAALRAAEAPAQHGVRPHVIVTIDHETLLSGAGAVASEWLGTRPFSEVRGLLADAGVSRLLTDPTGLPLEAGESVRTVPQGLWRALVVRDGGCIADSCSAPAAWCDVAHLEVPYRLDGKLSLSNAGLLCRTHHRRYDADGWKVIWDRDRPVVRPPGSNVRRRAAIRNRPGSARQREPGAGSAQIRSSQDMSASGSAGSPPTRIRGSGSGSGSGTRGPSGSARGDLSLWVSDPP